MNKFFVNLTDARVNRIRRELKENGLKFDLDAYCTNEYDVLQQKVDANKKILSDFLGFDVDLNDRSMAAKLVMTDLPPNFFFDIYTNDPFEHLEKHRRENSNFALWYETAKTERMLREINPGKLRENMDELNRIHGKWTIAADSTGRLICSDPPLQSMPKSARKFMIPEKGIILLTADYSAIELRVLAKLTGDPDLIADLGPGKDLHRKTAAIIFNKRQADISEEERQIGKTTNFLICYGGSEDGLQKKLDKTGVELPADLDVQKIIYRFFKAYPIVYYYQYRLRKLQIPPKTLSGKEFFHLSETQRLNYPIQGSAAEGFIQALYEVVSKKPGGYRLVMAIHDSITLEVPEEQKDEAADFLKTTTEKVMGDFLAPVPVFVEIKQGI